MNLDQHPIRFVQGLAQRHGYDIELSFSSYFYRPASVFDERYAFWVSASEVNDAWLLDQISSLPEGWEIAFNSLMKDGRGRTQHVGLVDFAEGASIDLIKSAVYKLLGENALRLLQVYESGRSYHGYIEEIMIPKEWRSFLGRLLLMNDVSSNPVVDSRWVGHRLVGGYCALRWSMNSTWYLSMPTRVF